MQQSSVKPGDTVAFEQPAANGRKQGLVVSVCRTADPLVLIDCNGTLAIRLTSEITVISTAETPAG